MLQFCFWLAFLYFKSYVFTAYNYDSWMNILMKFLLIKSQDDVLITIITSYKFYMLISSHVFV